MPADRIVAEHEIAALAAADACLGARQIGDATAIRTGDDLDAKLASSQLPPRSVADQGARIAWISGRCGNDVRSSLMASSGATEPSLGRLGKYELLKRLAIGGMGEIFLARERGLAGFDRLVVVKRLLPELAERAGMVDLFTDEARIVAHLAHPNIVQIYDFGFEDHAFFLAMEYVQGHNVARLWSRAEQANEVLPRALAIHIIAEMAAALDFAHHACDAQGRPLGIVHRDVSPQNVLVSIHGDVKLMDFGIAKAANKTHRTQTGVVRGKFSYMSPEQLAGGEVDPRSDVFSTGVMLFELTLGRRLFTGRNDVEVIDSLRQMPIPRPRTIDPAYPPALEELVLGALERDLVRRTASAGELASGLRDVLAALGDRLDKPAVGAFVQRLVPETSATPSGPATDVRTTPVPGTRALVAAAADAPSIEIVERRARRRWPWVAVGLVALAGAGGFAAWTYWSGEREAPVAQPAAVTAPADAGVAVAVVADASVAPEPEPPADAAIIAATPPDAGVATHAHHHRTQTVAHAPADPAPKPPPPEPAQPVMSPPHTGTLVVDSTPWGTVVANGKKLGTTQVNEPMAPGRYSLELQLSENAGTLTAAAVIESDRKTKCRGAAGKLTCESPR
jgi:serine/threonine protein kinase